jgi:hypothetical protein
MAHYGDWVPGREQDLVELTDRWRKILDDVAKQTLYGWEANTCKMVVDAIAEFLTARTAFLDNNSTENRIIKDEKKKIAVSAMRKFAREHIRYNSKVDDETRVYLGLPIYGNARSIIPVPQAQCIGKASNPGLHLVKIDLSGYSILTADQRSNYGVRIYWGILPPGEITVEMVSGPKHYLAKIPESGEMLGNSLFTRKKRHVFDFDGDSGNRVFFCCRLKTVKVK